MRTQSPVKLPRALEGHHQRGGVKTMTLGQVPLMVSWVISPAIVTEGEDRNRFDVEGIAGEGLAKNRGRSW